MSHIIEIGHFADWDDCDLACHVTCHFKVPKSLFPVFVLLYFVNYGLIFEK